MKKIFICLSNVLMSFFFVWIVTVWGDSYVSYHYPNIAVFDSDVETSFEQVSRELMQLADETESVIGIQHQDIGVDGESVFSYTILGEGNLPDGLLIKATEEGVKNSVETNYFIFDGNLTLEHLRQTLSELGLNNLYVSYPSQVATLLALFSTGFQMISLMLFLLIFGALSLISQITHLRTVGIRLISGERRWSVFLKPVGLDSLDIAIGFVLGLITTAILSRFVTIPSVTLKTIGLGLIVFNLLLCGISLCLAIIFLMVINKVHLMSLIKGQLPIRGIMTLIVLGQLLAVIIIATGINHAFIFSKVMMQHEQGQTMWNRENQVTVLSMSRQGVDTSRGWEGILEKQRVWFDMMSQAVEEDKAFLSRHYLAERVMQRGISSMDNLSTSTVWQDYRPEGNVLIVTPHYFVHQQISLSSDIEQKLSHLQQGEFILLLPENLRDETLYYQTMFEEDLTNRLASQDARQEMTATVDYLEMEQARFVYNTIPISYQQFVKDPIIIVLTPQSTGEQSFMFWANALSNYFLFNTVEDAHSLIKAYDIENWVSELNTANNIYHILMGNIKREQWTTIAGVMLGIQTAILIFHTMNQLYFEKFRREILIKRISGLYFLEIHKKYVLVQLGTVLLGLIVSLCFGVAGKIALIVGFMFSVLSLLQLYRQMKKEDKISVLILKGG